MWNDIHFLCCREVKVNGLSSDQPPLDRTRDQLSPSEREVDNFFSDPAKIDKLISYLSLEDKKGKDKFDAMRFYLFKVKRYTEGELIG